MVAMAAMIIARLQPHKHCTVQGQDGTVLCTVLSTHQCHSVLAILVISPRCQYVQANARRSVGFYLKPVHFALLSFALTTLWPMVEAERERERERLFHRKAKTQRVLNCWNSKAWAMVPSTCHCAKKGKRRSHIASRCCVYL